MSPFEHLLATLLQSPEPDSARCAELATLASSDPQRREAALLALEVGAFGLAQELAARVSDPAQRAPIEALLGEATETHSPSLAASSTGESPPADDADAAELIDDDEVTSLFEPTKPSVDRETVEAFMTWFGGRRDLYARQWFDPRRKRSGYAPVREPLTPRVVAQHLEGTITIGQYLLRPDGTCDYGVLDLDLDASALAELRATRGEEVGALDHAALASFARRVRDAATQLGLAATLENSGGRGVHAWIFFRPRRSAKAVRSVLAQLLVAAGSPPTDVKVELFPKQERVGPRGLSSLVKLPLGVHRVTGHRCSLLDEGLRPLPPAVALAQLRACSDPVIDALVGRRLLALPAPELAPAEAVPEAPAPRRVALPEALRAIAPGREEREAADRLLAACSVLRGIVSTAYQARRLEPEEARAITYTLGLLGSDPRTARDVLSVGGASMRELDRLARGLPSPAGCSRLQRLSERPACEGCPRGTLPYPTPVLFAVDSPLEPMTRPPELPPEAEAMLAVETPLETIGRVLRNIEDRLARLEPARKEPGS